MARKQHHWLGGEMLVLGVFASVALAGLLYGAVAAAVADREDPMPVQEAPVAPTTEEYRTETAAVMADFWGQAARMTRADVAAADPRFAEIVAKTQERLLRVRVPKDEREAHLSFVLLLDKWKRALGGSEADIQGVLEKSEEVLTANPWVVAVPR